MVGATNNLQHPSFSPAGAAPTDTPPVGNAALPPALPSTASWSAGCQTSLLRLKAPGARFQRIYGYDLAVGAAAPATSLPASTALADLLPPLAPAAGAGGGAGPAAQKVHRRVLSVQLRHTLPGHHYQLLHLDRRHHHKCDTADSVNCHITCASHNACASLSACSMPV
jgi:hypothetical protein